MRASTRDRMLTNPRHPKSILIVTCKKLLICPKNSGGKIKQLSRQEIVHMHNRAFHARGIDFNTKTTKNKIKTSIKVTKNN